MRLLVYGTIILFCLLILKQAGEVWIEYNADKNAWKEVESIISSIEPKYSNESNVFQLKDRLFIRIEDKIYLLKTYND